MSVDDHSIEPDSSFEMPRQTPQEFDAGPLGLLPWVWGQQSRLGSRLARVETGVGFRQALAWLEGPLRGGVEFGRPEILWRAAGIRRAGVVAQFAWPRMTTRLALGLETTVAHAVVDRLLGFDRLPEEGRSPLSPVEWGVLTFVIAETLRRFDADKGRPFGLWDLTVDRVGPDPFDTAGLGRVVTVRWPLSLGSVTGSIRLWLPEALVSRWLSSEPVPPAGSTHLVTRPESLSTVWKAEGGKISLPRGLKTLRTGGVLPVTDSRLGGTPQSPTGAVNLTLNLQGRGGRYLIGAEPVPLTGGGRLTVTAPVRHEPKPREAITLSTPATPASADTNATAANDVPVTLVVELGRLNLTLGRLADLKPGDVLELGRHSREPIELTSGGRLVARGELVLIDTELGVRVTHLFL